MSEIYRFAGLELDTSRFQVRRAGKALAVQPQSAALRGLQFEKMREDPLVVAVARDHPLATRRTVAPRELISEPFVIFSRQEYPEHAEGIQEMLGGRAVRMRIGQE